MGGGPRRPREQAPVGGLADETIAAGPGGHERREGEAIHEQRAEHVPTLREVTEQDSAGVRRTLPQQVLQARAVHGGRRGRLRHYDTLPLQRQAALLFCDEGLQQGVGWRVRVGSSRDGLREPLLTPPDELDLVIETPPPVVALPFLLLQALERGVHRRVDDPRIEGGRHGLEDGRVKDRVREVQIVAADLGSALRVVAAAIEEPAPPTVMPTHGDEGTVADAAPQPAQQVGGGLIETWSDRAGRPRRRAWREDRLALRQLPMSGVPQLIGDDPQLWGLARQEVVGRPPALSFGAALMHFLGTVPRDKPPVVVPVEHLANGGGGPALAAGAGRRFVIGIELLGDPGEAPAVGAEREEPADDGGLRGVDPARDVLAYGTAVGTGSGDLDVVVPIALPARDVPRLELAAHGVVGALLGTLPLELARIGGHGQEDLVGGGVERALPVFLVEEDAHPGIEDLLQGVAGLDGFPPQAGLLGHDEHVEGRAWAEGIHEPEKARALDELGAADAVVDVDGLVEDQPAMLSGIVPRVLDLPGHGALVLADPDLVGGLASVDGGEQGTGARRDMRSRRMPAPGTHAEAPSVVAAPLSGSARSWSRASARAETTAVKTAGGQSQEGSGEGIRRGTVPNGDIVTRPWARI